MEQKKKYLCIETLVSNSASEQEEKVISSVRTIPELSKCPANPEQVMAALQFLSDGMIIQISIKDEPIDFNKPVVEVNL